MRVRFWGTRGSLPVSLTWRDVRDRLARALVAASGRQLDTIEKAYAFAEGELDFSLTHTFGGHSSCVEFELPGGAAGDEYFVCDMGSGARPFGDHVLARQAGRAASVNIFMSHVHWDHIMGFPFLGPAYVPNTRIRIYGCHEELEHAFRLQQNPPCFPVPFTQLAASIEFVRLAPGVTREVSGVRVTPKLQLHSGDSFGYRFEHAGKTLIYTTDSEHKLERKDETENIVAFFRDADLVVFDAMYSLAEAVSVKADWGHSSNIVGVELCQMARARKLALFHHEPANDDAAIERILRETRRLEELTRSGHRLEVLAAYDGLEVDL
jgi:phosphoribosyl 1,2-cyclic phosphodiesterase